ncbi:MAG: MBL fold metallo-hydrolase [Clostridia bacterium]|nr:MBL fold metallo-hydrolase [Clostridia bacterium]
MLNSNYSLLKLKVEFLNYKNFCYIIVDKDSQEAAIIDPAWDIDKISDKIGQLDVKLTSIFLTHSHYDHTNLAEHLVKRYNSHVFMSKDEINHYGYRCPKLNALSDKDSIYIGNTKVSCMLTPGHTFGSSCYLLQGSLFTGDTVFIEGCGICTGTGASAEQMYDSIQNIKNNVSHDTKIYPGHSYGKMPGYSLSYLLKENIYFQIDNKDIFISYRMRKNQGNLFDFK